MILAIPFLMEKPKNIKSSNKDGIKVELFGVGIELDGLVGQKTISGKLNI